MMIKVMKICLIHNRWRNNARGGAERILETMAAFLCQSGHEVVVITTTSEKNTKVEKEAPGLTIYYLSSSFGHLEEWPLTWRLFWHLKQFFSGKSYQQIKEILEKEKVDVVWTHNLMGFGAKSLGLGNIKTIRHLHTLHDVQYLYPSGLVYWGQEYILKTPWARLYQFLVRRNISDRTFIISPSTWLLQLYQQRGFFKNQQVIVLPNPGGEKKVEISKQNIEGIPTFLYVGQVEAHKGIQLLTEAFQGIDSARLVVVGDGSLLSSLQSQASENIIFRGRCSTKEVKEEMKKADCLVVPSLCYENYPTVLLEVAALGLPAIGSACGGIAEILQDSRLLFTPNLEELKKKIIWVKDNCQECSDIALTRYQAINFLSPEEYWNKILELVSKEITQN